MANPQGKVDPLEQWRELRDTYMDIWAKASGEAVNSEAYAQATGTMLDAFLATSSPYRDAQKKAMVSALEQCNMPSRDDYVRLADRLGNLELLLDDMDAKLRQMYQLIAKLAASQQPSAQQPSARVTSIPAKPVAAEVAPAGAHASAPELTAPAEAPVERATPESKVIAESKAALEQAQRPSKPKARGTSPKSTKKGV